MRSAANPSCPLRWHELHGPRSEGVFEACAAPPPPRVPWKGGEEAPPPPPSRAPSPRPATVFPTPSASLNGICNRQ